MGKVIRNFFWHQNFVPKGLSVPALGLDTCIKSFKIYLKSYFKEIVFKLATNGQNDKGFLLTSTFVRKGLSAPALGLYTCIKALKYIPGPGVRWAFTGPLVLWSWKLIIFLRTHYIDSFYNCTGAQLQKDVHTADSTACTSRQSDHSPCCMHETFSACLPTMWHPVLTDLTVLMCKLIWVFGADIILKVLLSSSSFYEPKRDKTNKMTYLPSEVGLGICLVWSESSLGTLWVAKDPKLLQADSDHEDFDQTGWMPRLIRAFARFKCHFVGFVVLLLSCFFAAPLHLSRAMRKCVLCHMRTTKA